MFGIGTTELLVVLVIVIIIFGAGKLPEIGSGLGKAIRGFKKGVLESEKEETKVAVEKTETKEKVEAGEKVETDKIEEK